MKTTTIITLFNLICATTITAQEFKIHMADTPTPKYGTTSTNSNTTPYHYTEPIKIESPSQVTETRVTGYYEEGYGASAKWVSISLRIIIKTDAYGKDEITVKAYKTITSDYWSDVSYGTVNKTYGSMAKEFTHQTFVASKTVYFSI